MDILYNELHNNLFEALWREEAMSVSDAGETEEEGYAFETAE